MVTKFHETEFKNDQPVNEESWKKKQRDVMDVGFSNSSTFSPYCHGIMPTKYFKN